MSNFTRSCFKGSSAGVLRTRVVSEKLSAILPVVKDLGQKAKLSKALASDRLTQL